MVKSSKGPTGLFAGAQGYATHPLTGRVIQGGGPVTASDMRRLRAIVAKQPGFANDQVFWQRFYNLDKEGREAYLEAFETAYRMKSAKAPTARITSDTTGAQQMMGRIANHLSKLDPWSQRAGRLLTDADQLLANAKAELGNDRAGGLSTSIAGIRVQASMLAQMASLPLEFGSGTRSEAPMPARWKRVINLLILAGRRLSELATVLKDGGFQQAVATCQSMANRAQQLATAAGRYYAADMRTARAAEEGKPQQYFIGKSTKPGGEMRVLSAIRYALNYAGGAVHQTEQLGNQAPRALRNAAFQMGSAITLLQQAAGMVNDNLHLTGRRLKTAERFSDHAMDYVRGLNKEDIPRAIAANFETAGLYLQRAIQEAERWAPAPGVLSTQRFSKANGIVVPAGARVHIPPIIGDRFQINGRTFVIQQAHRFSNVPDGPNVRRWSVYAYLLGGKGVIYDFPATEDGRLGNGSSLGRWVTLEPKDRQKPYAEYPGVLSTQAFNKAFASPEARDAYIKKIGQYLNAAYQMARQAMHAYNMISSRQIAEQVRPVQQALSNIALYLSREKDWFSDTGGVRPPEINQSNDAEWTNHLVSATARLGHVLDLISYVVSKQKYLQPLDDKQKQIIANTLPLLDKLRRMIQVAAHLIAGTSYSVANGKAMGEGMDTAGGYLVPGEHGSKPIEMLLPAGKGVTAKAGAPTPPSGGTVTRQTAIVTLDGEKLKADLTYGYTIDYDFTDISQVKQFMGRAQATGFRLGDTGRALEAHERQGMGIPMGIDWKVTLMRSKSELARIAGRLNAEHPKAVTFKLADGHTGIPDAKPSMTVYADGMNIGTVAFREHVQALYAIAKRLGAKVRSQNSAGMMPVAAAFSTAGTGKSASKALPPLLPGGQGYSGTARASLRRAGAGPAEIILHWKLEYEQKKEYTFQTAQEMKQFYSMAQKAGYRVMTRKPLNAEQPQASEGAQLVLDLQEIRAKLPIIKTFMEFSDTFIIEHHHGKGFRGFGMQKPKEGGRGYPTATIITVKTERGARALQSAAQAAGWKVIWR